METIGEMYRIKGIYYLRRLPCCKVRLAVYKHLYKMGIKGAPKKFLSVHLRHESESLKKMVYEMMVGKRGVVYPKALLFILRAVGEDVEADSSCGFKK